ncbi:MAG: PAS domain S-box protein, partial [Deltaproteobacteria bacterium]|nr:PAS domain S-box protein [Deltaproteobacteria bacterium]
MVRSSTEAQGALFEKEDFYREIVENANSIILRMDIKGSLKFMNRYGQSFFGYQEDELIGRNVMDTIVPNKILLKRDLTALLVDFEKDHEKYIYNEFENMRKGGQRVSIAWTNKAVFNTKNKLKEIISIGNDITQRVQAERALKVSEANYRSIYNAVSDAILVQASMTGEILDANQGACEMFKCEIKDLLGAHIYK